MTESPIEECLSEVNHLIGHFCVNRYVYSVALTSFSETQKRIIDLHEKAEGRRATIEEMDGSSFTFGEGHPDDPAFRTFHTTTQGAYKLRVEKDGLDTQLSIRNTLVSIYGIWEDNYRERIAKALGVEKGHLKCDVIGELRNIRRAIVHRNSRALPECEKHIRLKRFSRDSEILYYGDEGMDDLLKIRKAIAELG